MKISGLQKVSVIDYPGEIACTIFLHGCNFRCGFCYNPELVLGSSESGVGSLESGGFSEEYVLDFLKQRIGKLDAVCITGGEPLMTLDFDFVRKIKDLGFKVKIDTNGSFPNRLKEMIDLGLVDYVAMDIKSCREDYSEVVGVEVDMSKIEESIKMIHDFGEYEFRTTTVGRLHDAYSMMAMGKWLNSVCGAKPKRFFLQGFKKNKDGMIDSSYMDELDVGEKFLVELKDCVKDWFELVEVRC
jgi:pyruvate formate lyase activating enzyme